MTTPRFYFAALVLVLLSVSSRSDAQPGWTPIAKSRDGCATSYQMFKTRPSPEHIRFWMQIACDSDQSSQMDQKAVNWASSHNRIYMNCSTEQWWTETTLYYARDKTLLHTFKPSLLGIDIDGPGMERQKISAEAIPPGTVMAFVANRECKAGK